MARNADLETRMRRGEWFHGLTVPGGMWQRRGVGLWWETFTREGWDPIREAAVTVQRRRLRHDDRLPIGVEYRDMVAEQMSVTSPEQYACESCSGTFLKGWGDDEALVESHTVFGVELREDDRALICDQCYEQFRAWWDTLIPAEREQLERDAGYRP